jgi:CRISPR-associated protein Csx3
MRHEPVHPAVLIGGPPHTGKTVLTYSLTRALRQDGVEHYVMRACPDGEGHWSQETPRLVAEALRHSHKGTYTHEFVQRVCADIARRRVPFIVDVGGLPQDDQFQIFQHCTHAILLRHRASAASDWQRIIEQNRLCLLADLISELEGVPTLETQTPVLRGTLAGLHRGSTIQGEPFASLVRCLVALFRSTTGGLSETYLAEAPTSLVLNLPRILDTLASGSQDWTPEMLPRLLAQVPAHTPLSVYGWAAYWVYAALALHAQPAFFSQFDTRLGWLEPLSLQIGSSIHPEIVLEAVNGEHFTLLQSSLRTHNLDYTQLSSLHVPRLPPDQGVVMSGKLPLWLTSSLAISYYQAGAPWIAGYYPQLQGAIVIFSRVPEYALGNLLPITLSNHN